ncbi:unnamed protein product [Orchesella dallaii]|uniref:Uncharacterized protein n=1 Tax=Orchesella dallaii TaxID=48710 RepID=A0ABP1QXP8_9HEXA
MKVAPLVGFLVVVAVIDLAHGRPLEVEKSPRDASVYVLGSLYNTAVSHNFSKSQAASDRNESEWNNTEMLNGVQKSQQGDEASGTRHRQRRQLKSGGGGVLIYSGGDAANLAVAFKGSESQAAENDQKSGYNNQNLGMGESMIDEENEEEY